MTPVEFKNFANAKRKEFFAKFPKPSKSGPRAFWAQINRHADNALEDNDWNPDVFGAAAKKIETLLS